MQALEERDNGPLAGGGDITQGLDVAALVAKLPTRDQGADVEKRRVLFASADSSNNGTLTLSEVYTYVCMCYLSMYVCVHVCMHACMHACMYVWLLTLSEVVQGVNALLTLTLP